ncbi:unnamed protein product [Ixodes persulcatus]
MSINPTVLHCPDSCETRKLKKGRKSGVGTRLPRKVQWARHPKGEQYSCQRFPLEALPRSAKANKKGWKKDSDKLLLLPMTREASSNQGRVRMGGLEPLATPPRGGAQLRVLKNNTTIQKAGKKTFSQ